MRTAQSTRQFVIACNGQLRYLINEYLVVGYKFIYWRNISLC